MQMDVHPQFLWSKTHIPRYSPDRPNKNSPTHRLTDHYSCSRINQSSQPFEQGVNNKNVILSQSLPTKSIRNIPIQNWLVLESADGFLGHHQFQCFHQNSNSENYISWGGTRPIFRHTQIWIVVGQLTPMISYDLPIDVPSNSHVLQFSTHMILDDPSIPPGGPRKKNTPDRA